MLTTFLFLQSNEQNLSQYIEIHITVAICFALKLFALTLQTKNYNGLLINFFVSVSFFFFLSFFLSLFACLPIHFSFFNFSTFDLQISLLNPQIFLSIFTFLLTETKRLKFLICSKNNLFLGIEFVGGLATKKRLTSATIGAQIGVQTLEGANHRPPMFECRYLNRQFGIQMLAADILILYYADPNLGILTSIADV